MQISLALNLKFIKYFSVQTSDSRNNKRNLLGFFFQPKLAVNPVILPQIILSLRLTSMENILKTTKI